MGIFFGFEILEEVSISSDGVLKGNILFISVEVFVGIFVDVGSFVMEDKLFFSVFGLSGGSLVSFLISGNSMEFIINDSDLVVCREIVGVYEINDNKIYVVKNNGFLWVKYV